tara:strand:- start:427 stop:855 length:429 start_codon:yes stop_codon:yes gene_type:complete
MKLELKHLAPYLPYGLEYVKYSDHNSPIRHDIMQGISTNGVYASGDITPVLFKNCKPILRPLSDLSKEIEVNGEKFKPSFVLSRDYKNAEEFIHLIITEKEEDYYKDILSHMPLCIAQKLFEYHFDVFGLIEKKLAIDINTI